MSFRSMHAALQTYLASNVGLVDGLSRINFGRVKHSVALTGPQLLSLFPFIKDNLSPNVSSNQRNTEVRHEIGVPHITGPVQERPLPQTEFHATWRRDTGELKLENGNTRVMDALKNVGHQFWEEVTLEVYEVDSEKEAATIYKCFDSRDAVKQGKHDVQSLFRNAGLLPFLTSKRMRHATSLVTPLRSLTKKPFTKTTATEIAAHKSTLVAIDAFLLGLEGVESKVPAKEVSAVFGGGELAGLMQFYSESHLDTARAPYLTDIMGHVLSTMEYRIMGSRKTSPFDSYYENYVTATEQLGRSGSKVVPDRAKVFKLMLEDYLAALKAAATATKAKRSGSRSK